MIVRSISFLLALLFFVNSGRTQTYDPARLYSKEALKADLRFVRENLEKKHAGLYRYITKPALNRFFDSLENVITGPMTEQEFFNLLTLLHSRIRNGHTMFLPGDSATAYKRRGLYLPFMVYWAEGKLTIIENNSTDSTIQPGMEIITINGTSSASIIEQLLNRMTRDGYNQTYPTWVLNHYFSAYYSFTFGQPDTFQLQLKDKAGELLMKQVAALTKDSIKHLKQIRYAVASNERGIYWEEKEHHTAVLTIKTFDSDQLKEKYKQDYKKVFDSLFKQINRHQIKNLVLDLRDNQGGNFYPGQSLLSYLVSSPCRFLLDGKEATIIQPKAGRFKGKLFVLMNGGSFSNTAIVCATLKRDRKVTFIGEETGGNAHVISGDPEEFMLPNTKIKAYISTVTYRIIADTNDGHGLKPDHSLQPSIEDLLTGKDPAKALVQQLIPD